MDLKLWVITKQKLGFVIWLFFLFNPAVFCANILFLFGGGNVSHKISIWPFVVGLAEVGHNVTFTSSSNRVISHHPRVTDITPKPFLEYTKSLYSNVDRIQTRIEGKSWDITAPVYHKASLDYCHVLFDLYEEDATFRGLFQKDKVDLIIINAAFQEFFPWFYGAFGVPLEASVIPDLMAGVSFPPGILDRMHTVYRHYQGHLRDPAFSNAMEQLYIKKFKPKYLPPSVAEIERNASLVFLNSHYSIDFARSLSPYFVNIGGMQCWSEVGELTKEFKDYMDEAEDGVVLITFGSTIDLAKLDYKYTSVFLNMMRKFEKIKFIWRWDGPMPPDSPSNVMASSWLPQRQILDHPKTIAFMTHGGLNSINEATFHGVPLIVFPLFADQDFNAYRVQAQGVGVSVEFRTFSQEAIDSAVGEVLTNKMYKRKMTVRSKVFKDRPRSPAEEAIFWTEFALRQDDTSALKPMLLEQSFFVRQSVDVYFALFIIFIIFPLILIYVLTRLTQ